VSSIKSPEDAATHPAARSFSQVMPSAAVCFVGAAAAAALLRWWGPKNVIVRAVAAATAAAPPLLLAVHVGAAGSSERRATVTLCGVTAVSAFSLVFFSHPKRQKNLNEVRALDGISDSVAGDVMAMGVPVARVANAAAPWSKVLLDVGAGLASAAAKVSLSVYLTASLAQCAPVSSVASSRGVALCWLVAAKAVADTWDEDVLGALVSLFTRGKWRMLRAFDGVLLSRGFADFWGRRHAQAWMRLLRDRVYQPLRERGVSQRVAWHAIFAVSGVVHAWMSRNAFGAGNEVAVLAFYLANGAAAVYEGDAAAATGLAPRVLFVAVFCALLPLLVGDQVRNVGQIVHDTDVTSFGPLTQELLQPYLLRV
jgi:hypothetical protein